MRHAFVGWRVIWKQASRPPRRLGQRSSRATAQRSLRPQAPPSRPPRWRKRSHGYDEQAAHGVLDRSLATFSTEAVLFDIVMPVLHSLGERWAVGQLTIAQEHFASSVLRGRLLGLARGWGRGAGPIALLACPPGEQHDLPLLLFGIPLREAGWRIVFLGAETPISTVERAVVRVAPRAVVLSAVRPEPLRAVEQELAALATRVPVAIGGQGADAALAGRAGAVLLDDDPVEAASSLAERILP